MIKKATALLIILLSLTACWDMQDIEELGFVLALSIDPIDKEERKELEEKYQKETSREPEQLFKTTYQIVIPGSLTDNYAFEEQAFFNVSTVGRSNFKSNRQIAARRSRRLNFEHLKAIIINEELARAGALKNLIDFYIRDHEMRRTTLVYISNGKGFDILSKKLPLEIMPAISIRMTQDNYPAYHGMPYPKDAGRLATCIIDEKSYIVPRISAGPSNDMVVAGAAVFLGKTNEMVGWLGEVDLEGYNLVMGESDNAIVEVSHEDGLFVFEIDTMDTIYDYKQKNGDLHFQIDVKAEGMFVESMLDELTISEQAEAEKIAEATEKEMKRLATAIVKKMQHEFYTDVFELYKLVKKQDYNYWKEIAEDWDGKDGFFSKANVEINVEVEIRHYMTKEKLT